MRITVCWATPQRQFERVLELAASSSVEAALLRLREELTNEPAAPGAVPAWDRCAVGVFGELRARDSLLREGDRLEIYRPLLTDPKEGRRARARRPR